MRELKLVRAVVQKIIPNGKHGPYAVASCEALDISFTFSLKQGVWLEDSWPEHGNEIWVKDFRKKRAGWRAHQVWLVRPDEQ